LVGGRRGWHGPIDVGVDGGVQFVVFLAALLRNELLLLLFGGKFLFAKGLERGEGLVEGAFVGGLVAEEDGKGGGNFAGGRDGEGFALESDGAIFEPVVAGQVFDEERFDEVGWPVVGEEAVS